ncbi:MAG TPA: polyprenol monophosphomannose synthase [Polyangiaceae bacterium]
MRITVVVPTYNEAENLPVLARSLLALGPDIRLLVVDDNSPDGTGAEADRLAAAHPDQVAVHHRPVRQGLRSAYLEGFRIAVEAKPDAVAQMDADLSHEPGCLLAMGNALERADLVLGSRYVPGGSVDQRWPAWRKGLSAFGNQYARTILGLPQRDLTTGFRLWRSDALERMPLHDVRANGYVFLVEMAYLAHALGLRIAEVPIHFPDRSRGESKMSLRIQVEAAFRVWQMKWDHERRRGA